MAKEQPKPKSKKDTSTPFQKFDRLAKRIIRVPKSEADKVAEKRRSGYPSSPQT
jgi:hypothetical protein